MKDRRTTFYLLAIVIMKIVQKVQNKTMHRLETSILKCIITNI